MEAILKELTQIQNVADLQRELSKAVAVLKALKAGTITLENLTVDGDRWALAEVVPPAPVEAAPVEAVPDAPEN